jgi:hypothetical protein
MPKNVCTGPKIPKNAEKSQKNPKKSQKNPKKCFKLQYMSCMHQDDIHMPKNSQKRNQSRLGA